MSKAINLDELRRREKLLKKYWDPSMLKGIYYDVLDGKFPVGDYEIIRDGMARAFPNMTADALKEIKQINVQLGITGSPKVKMTKQEAVEFIRKMGYSVEKARFGYLVEVDTADNLGWHYWRPTRRLAESTGRARLFEEVALVEEQNGLVSKNVSSRTVTRKTAYQIHPSYIPSDKETWEEQFNSLG